MNSIASLSRTDSPAVGGAVPVAFSTAVATMLLSVLLISLRPFQDPGPAASGGDTVNQIGFAFVGAVSLAALFLIADRERVRAVASPWWLLLLAFVGIGVVNALDPAAATRAALFTLIGIVTVAAVLCIPRGADTFSNVLQYTGSAVLLLCYAGLLLSSEAVHHAGPIEGEHAGLWRGLFAHKNIAGPVMACIGFCGIYLFRRGRRRTGFLMFLAAILFVVNTGSKTTLVLVPAALLAVTVPTLFGWRRLVPLFCLLALAAAATVTVGSVFIEPVNQLVQTVLPGATYTGRTALWSYAAEMIAREPITGYGYESFWRTPLVTDAERAFDSAWDFRGIVHGHNGYIDIALLLGLPAMLCAMVTFVVVPARDFLRTPLLRENVLAADLFMTMWFFLSANALLESFFLRRVDPVWILFVLAVLGLRLNARFTHSAVRATDRSLA